MTRTRKPYRLLDGVFLLDKPTGCSSNAALQKVRWLFEAKKAGHTGSLDPLASGLLPVCFGEATKFSSHLLNSDKRYTVRVRLGAETDSADSDGSVVARFDLPSLTADSIESALDSFRGEILQVPPMYSALKHQGQRLYELARKGIEVERAARLVTIHEALVLGFGVDWIDLDVLCSKGTYIRSLALDLGRALGSGAHVEVLRRTGVADSRIESAITIETLEAMSLGEREACLMPVDALVSQWPPIHLDPEAARLADHGNPFQLHDAPSEGWVRIYGERGFMGLGEITAPGCIAPRRMVTHPPTKA
jgi:tRNA pseudouridine55 synthase